MLLEFKIKNYKSFKEEATLSLLPAPKQKDLEYSVLEAKANNKLFKAIPTSVVYGPNASGKSNLIGALDTLVALINRGHIRNEEKSSGLNVASNALELIPNKDLKNSVPVEFYLSFIKNNKHFAYTLKLDLGTFLDLSYRRKVIYENLTVNDKELFVRNDVLKINETPNKNFNATLVRLLATNLHDEELFLTNGYKNVVNNELYNELLSFLNNDLLVLYRANNMGISAKLNEKANILKPLGLSDVAHEIGALNSDIGFYNPKEGHEGILTTFIKNEKENKLTAIPADIIESYGTVRFLHLYPFLNKALNDGGVLVIDEFDASLHPMLLLELVNIFHNDELNKNNAQLIFNTHNPIFLNAAVMRRDEIKFVERDENGSQLYALSDFQTSGPEGVRKTDDYMKHYFINKYGAIVDVDLSDKIFGVVHAQDD